MHLYRKTYLQKSLPKKCLERLFRAEGNGKKVFYKHRFKGRKYGVLDKRLSNQRVIQLLSILISPVSKLVFSGLYLQCCYINLYFVSVLNLDGVGARKSLWNYSSWRCTNSTKLVQIKQCVQTPTEQNTAAYIWKPEAGFSFLSSWEGEDMRSGHHFLERESLKQH